MRLVVKSSWVVDNIVLARESLRATCHKTSVAILRARYVCYSSGGIDIAVNENGCSLSREGETKDSLATETVVF